MKIDPFSRNRQHLLACHEYYSCTQNGLFTFLLTFSESTGQEWIYIIYWIVGNTCWDYPCGAHALESFSPFESILYVNPALKWIKWRDGVITWILKTTCPLLIFWKGLRNWYGHGHATTDKKSKLISRARGKPFYFQFFELEHRSKSFLTTKLVFFIQLNENITVHSPLFLHFHFILRSCGKWFSTKLCFLLSLLPIFDCIRLLFNL